MSSNIQNILDEEFKLLIRATRNELFHFISVQYNHYDLVRKVKNDLVAQYLKRPNHSFNLDNCNPETFISDILASKSGLVFIEKFDLIFTEPFRSLCIGFNQRRDLFSTLPIQIIVFIPSGEESLQNFQKAMPDIFSIVNPMIQLFKEIKVNEFSNTIMDLNEFNFEGSKDARNEIERIRKRLQIIENTTVNTTLILSLKINLAKCYRFLGNYKDSKIVLEKLIEEIRSNNSDLEEYTYIIKNDLALNLIDLGDYENAKKLLEEAVIYTEKTFGKNHPNTAVRYSNLAVVLEDMGDYERAKILYQDALAIIEKSYGKDHHNTAISYSNFAGFLNIIGEYRRAKEYSEKSLFATEKNFGSNHINTAIRYSNLAVSLQNLGDYINAKNLFKKAYIIYVDNLGKNHPISKTIKRNLESVKKIM